MCVCTCLKFKFFLKNHQIKSKSINISPMLCKAINHINILCVCLLQKDNQNSWVERERERERKIGGRQRFAVLFVVKIMNIYHHKL